MTITVSESVRGCVIEREPHAWPIFGDGARTYRWEETNGLEVDTPGLARTTFALKGKWGELKERPSLSTRASDTRESILKTDTAACKLGWCFAVSPALPEPQGDSRRRNRSGRNGLPSSRRFGRRDGGKRGGRGGKSAGGGLTIGTGVIRRAHPRMAEPETNGASLHLGMILSCFICFYFIFLLPHRYFVYYLLCVMYLILL